MANKNSNASDRGNRETGRNPHWTDPIHGTDANGNEVTAQFGKGDRAGETLLRDGHKSDSEFMKDRNHDHYDGKGGGTNRGKYTR